VRFRDLHHAWYLLRTWPFDIFFSALLLSKEKGIEVDAHIKIPEVGLAGGKPQTSRHGHSVSNPADLLRVTHTSLSFRAGEGGGQGPDALLSEESVVEEDGLDSSLSSDVFNQSQTDGDVYIPFGSAFECEFVGLQSGKESLLSDPLKPIPKQFLELGKAIQKALEKAHEDLDPPVKYAIKEKFVITGEKKTAMRAVAVVRKSGKPLSTAVVNTIVKAFSERSLAPKQETPRAPASPQFDIAARESERSDESSISEAEDVASKQERNLAHAALDTVEGKLHAAAHASADDFVRANPGRRMSATVVMPGAEVRYSGETPMPQNRETPEHPIVVRCRIDVVAIKAYRVSFIEAAHLKRDDASAASEATWIPESFEAALGVDEKGESASPKEMLKKVFSLTNTGTYLVEAHVLVRESRGRTRYRVVAIEAATTSQQSEP